MSDLFTVAGLLLWGMGLKLWIFSKNLFSMFPFKYFKTCTQIYSTCTWFQWIPDCAFKLRVCCLFSCWGPQREAQGVSGEFIPSIHHRKGGKEGGGQRKSEEMKSVCVFSPFLLCWVRREVSSAFWQLGCETSAWMINCFMSPSCDHQATTSPLIYSSVCSTMKNKVCF